MQVAATRCRFVLTQPQAVLCISASKQFVAVARQDGNIELWTAKPNWLLVAVFAGSDPVETLAWGCVETQSATEKDRDPRSGYSGNKHQSRPYLYSGTLKGHVNAHCPKTQATTTFDSRGGAVWAIAASNNTLAVGCEDGHVRIFALNDHSLISTLEKQVGRVISLAWLGENIVTGSINGSVRIISTATTRTTIKMSLDKRKQINTVVWDILITATHVVTADSTGAVSFYDPEFGSLVSQIKLHRSDVMCLAYDPSTNSIYSSGVDSRIIKMNFVAQGSSDTLVGAWVVTSVTKHHSHNVRALAYLPKPHNLICSGGIDSSLCFMPIHTQNKKAQKVARMPMYPHKPAISFSSPARLLMSHFEDNIKLWKIGKISSTSETLPTHDGSNMVMQLNYKMKNHIKYSDISNDGTLIAVSDTKTTRIFNYINNLDATVKPILFDYILPGTHIMKFTKDSERLVCADSDRLLVHHMNQVSPAISIPITSYGPVTLMDVSNDGQFVCIATTSSKIQVYSLDTTNLFAWYTAPTMISAIRFWNSGLLVYGCSGRQFGVFDVDLKRVLVESSIEIAKTIVKRKLGAAKICDEITGRKPDVESISINSLEIEEKIEEKVVEESSLPKQQVKSGPRPFKKIIREDEPITGIFFDGSENRFSVYTPSIVYTSTISFSPDSNSAEPTPPATCSGTVGDMFHDIMFIDGVSGEGSGNVAEIVVVERPVLHSLAELPAPFIRHKYGR